MITLCGVACLIGMICWLSSEPNCLYGVDYFNLAPYQNNLLWGRAVLLITMYATSVYLVTLIGISSPENKKNHAAPAVPHDPAVHMVV